MPATKQAASTREPNHKNWRFYNPPHPVTGKPCPHPKSGWKFAYDDDEASPDKRSFVALDRDHRIAWGKDEIKMPQLKRMLHEVETNVAKSVFADYSDGEKQTSAMFGRSGIFLAPKHSDFVSRFIRHVAKRDSIILDCFGGSGSTAHAVIELNRNDRGARKHATVEVGEYFETVLKPRVMKAIYAGKWKDGEPVEGAAGSSHIFKYQHLESYEDTLNNIAFDPQLSPQPELLPAMPDYMLRYILDHETRSSDVRLNVDKLARPFDYALLLERNGETREEKVDLVETFNYLLGLHVQRRLMFSHQGRPYRVVRGRMGDEQVAVIWRDITGLDLQNDKVFIVGTVLKDVEADRIYINGDSYVPNAQSLDPIFKERMAG